MSASKYTPTRVAYFPFDIGKNVHWFAASTGSALQPVWPPRKVRATQAGFDEAATALTDLLAGGEFEQSLMGHEPTGLYHEAWARARRARFADALQPGTTPSLTYLFVNPYQTQPARQRKLGRNRKTDALDLPAIARCLLEGAGAPAYLPEARELRFQQWAAQFRQASQEGRAFTRRVVPGLDQLWPGALVNVARFRQMHPDLDPPVSLVLSRPLERELLQAVLTHGPDPHTLRALSEAELIAFWREDVGRGGPATAQRIRACATNGLWPPPDITAILAARVQADFAADQGVSARLAQLKTDAEQLLAGSLAQVLTTIPGLSPFLAARYLAGLGHPDRFASAAQVWAFAGFDPLPSDSGDMRRAGAISKHGDPVFRDTL